MSQLPFYPCRTECMAARSQSISVRRRSVGYRTSFGGLLSTGLLVAGLLLSGCGGEPPRPAPPPAKSAPRLPITEVVQTFSQNYEQTWDNMLAVLTQRGIDIQMANKELGRAVTTWVPMQDFMCGSVAGGDIPLACRVQFSMSVSRMIAEGSTLQIRYLETCADREELSLVCPNSKAEQLMLSIVDDLKAVAAVQEQAQ